MARGRGWLIAVAVLVAASAAPADTLLLTDGTTLTGEIKHTDDGWTVRDASGKVTQLPADRVKSIQLTPSTAPAAVNDRLDSLRRSVASMTNLDTIVDRYQRFIAQSPDPAVKLAAEQDLNGWIQKKQAGQIKFGNAWIDPSQRAALQEKALADAGQARDLIAQGRLKEADPLLQSALSTDPACASALYLRGLLLLRQDQFAAAKKLFDATLTLVPDHVPTLNNRAIALQRMNLVPAGLNDYDRAMIVSPEDKWVLGNVAEALHALPQDLQKNNAVVARVSRRYAEQIALLSPKMAAQGLYPWGATWVTAADLEKLHAAEAAIKTQLDQMSVDFDAAQANVARVEAAINDNNTAMRRIEAESVRYDNSGQLIRLAYPPSYYTLQQDNQNLIGERAGYVAKMEQLRTAAKTAQQKLPTPQYTGVQQIIGIEGTPVGPIAPGTQPTTQMSAPAIQAMPVTQPTTQTTQVIQPATQASPATQP